MSSRVRALAHFRRHDPVLYTAARRWHGMLPQELAAKRTRVALFAALVSIVISQQLGVKAADSIYRRVKEACDGRITPESVKKVSVERIRAAGLSGAKIRAIKGIADAVASGDLDLLSLKKEPAPTAHEALRSLWGLGPWSAEMFLMFAVGHPDIFSPGDLGLVRGVERIYGFSREKITRASLLTISEKWAPYRTFACLLLWRSRDATPSQLAKGRHR